MRDMKKQIEKERKDFLVPGAINIVVSANAGGAWSPFGDITTLMAWTAGKGTFTDFFEACCARKSAEIQYGYSVTHGRN